MLCVKCGVENIDGAKFCSGCGSPMEETNNLEVNADLTTTSADVETSADVVESTVKEPKKEEPKKEEVQKSNKKKIMKRILKFLLVMSIIGSILVGCTSTEKRETVTEYRDEDGNIIEAGLQIQLNGENEATITLADEAVGTLNSVKDTMETKGLYDISISLFSEDEAYQVNAMFDCEDFFLFVKTPDSEEPLRKEHENFNVNRTDETVSFTICKVGIASIINQCSKYRAELITNGQENTNSIVEGNTVDILSDSEKQQNLQVMLSEEDLVKFKIYEEDLKRMYYDDKAINIKIYETTESKDPLVDFGMFHSQIATGEGEVSGWFYNKDGSIKELIDDFKETQKGGKVKGMDYGVVMKFRYEGISEYLKPDYTYRLYFDNQIIESGKISNIFIKEEYSNIPPIPDAFPVNDEDEQYFKPTTDNYIVSMTTYPSVPFYDFDFAIGQDGKKKYVPVGQHISPVKVVKLITFDEFGILEEKTKTIYSDEIDAMVAFTNQNTVIDASQLAGSEAIDSPEVKVIFDSKDNENISNLYKDSAYYGRYGAVRYFDGSKERVNGNWIGDHIYLFGDEYSTKETITSEIEYNYQVFDFSKNNVGTREDNATMIVSGNREKTEPIDYEAEYKKYNTIYNEFNTRINEEQK